MLLRTAIAAFAAVVFLLPAAADVGAQEYRFDIGPHAGFAWWSDMMNDDFVDGSATVRFRESWLLGAQATAWFNPRFGLRANFGYTDRSVRHAGDRILDNVNLWSGSGDLLWRFVGPGHTFSPYLAVGAGAKWINPAATTFENRRNGAVITVNDEDFVLAEATRLMGLVALGTDIRLTPRYAVRAEVGDRFFDGPIYAIDPDGTLGAYASRLTHEVYGQIGLHVLLGLVAPARVAIAPLPPAPPPPPPPPPVEEEAFLLCIIDPMAPGGIREVDAVFLPATGDTLAVVNGERVPVRTAYPATAPTYVRTAEWFIAGRPLTMTVGDIRHDFVTFGATRIIEPEELTFLGTLEGVPLFAARTEVAAVAPTLAEAHATLRDLPRLMAGYPAVRAAVEQLSVVYAPYDIGCVFVPLQRIEEVLKVRG